MLEAIFTDYVDHITVNGLTQWDVGQKLKITLATLKGAFQVHFANKQDDTAYVVEGTATNGVGTVDIPNIILQKPVGAKAWIYVSDGNSGETIKTIDLPITSRAKPSDYIYSEIEIINYVKVKAEAEALVKAAAKSETNAKASATAASSSAATADAAKEYVDAIVAGNEAYTKHETNTMYASVIPQKATGNPILIQGSSGKPILDFNGFGRSTQNGTPTPDAPVDIVSVADSGTLEVKSEGKNLLPYPYYDGMGKTVNGVTTTIDENGLAHIKGTASAAANAFDFTFRDVEFPAGTYTISGVPEGASNTSYRAWLGIYKSGTTTEIKSAQVLANGFTFTTNEPFTMIFRATVVSGATVDAIYKPMLRRVEVTDDTYEPYKSSNVSIPLAEPLRSIGNVKDEIACVDGVYGVIRRINSNVFDGSDDETWSLQSTNTNGIANFQNYNGITYVPTNARCSHFVRSTIAIANVTTEGFLITTGSTYIRVNSSRASTVAKFREWLQSNPITIDYILAKEVFEPFGNQALFDALETYDKVTYITATDNAEIEVTYATDTKSYIDNKFAELQATLVNLL